MKKILIILTTIYMFMFPLFGYSQTCEQVDTVSYTHFYWKQNHLEVDEGLLILVEDKPTTYLTNNNWSSTSVSKTMLDNFIISMEDDGYLIHTHENYSISNEQVFLMVKFNKNQLLTEDNQ